MSWMIDPSHTRVQFSARHMMIATVRGEFKEFGGTVEFDETKPEATKVAVEIKTGSVDSKDAKRDGHLVSPDFFDAAKFPVMSFKSKRVENVKGERAKLIGDLTIKDVTHEVALDVEFHGLAKAPWGTTNAGFEAKGKLNRKDFGLVWNVALETGGVLVGEDVNITIDAEIVKQA
ncbi:MAG TPA: YceI family protein [Thermoflexales bacterium]|jgi:polyisoprenoid-binding protein YceI|nr:YceI family protein [Thermoflexales bacterium]